MEEILLYSEKHRLPLTEQIVIGMFREATKNRPIVHSRQAEAPLTIEEITAALKGRYRWDTERKAWDCSYRPFREWWVLLLKKENQNIFALQPQKIKAQKILAQYELNELQASQRTSPFKKVKHIVHDLSEHLPARC